MAFVPWRLLRGLGGCDWFVVVAAHGVVDHRHHLLRLYEVGCHLSARTEEILISAPVGVTSQYEVRIWRSK